jgi:hypothetical protein
MTEAKESSFQHGEFLYEEIFDKVVKLDAITVVPLLEGMLKLKHN